MDPEGAAAREAGGGVPPRFEPTRRHLSPRQAEVAAELVRAAEDEVSASGYGGLSVRNVARRAGVAPATAYNYFSSKDHLMAEVLWRIVRDLPPVDADGGPWDRRLHEAVGAMVRFAVESPELADACTVALLSPHPEVKHLRDRIGAAHHRYLTDALGPDADPLVVRVLEAAYAGTLVAAGTGHQSFEEIPDFMVDAARLMLAPPAPAPAPAPERGAIGPRAVDGTGRPRSALPGGRTQRETAVLR